MISLLLYNCQCYLILLPFWTWVPFLRQSAPSEELVRARKAFGSSALCAVYTVPA
ncbi:hypothetical protein SERLA73DRAFT_136031 [Serpula lacrymans var. lacrymans S7.3]|uniref:Uncharacterized protein n=2 Tax=Serpula lacrymans var. lacrymans TaxID=341189 RepID=F8PW95_SERL3|nr:uncharacterized protein SERLADRAFT_388360 [Serpula lacrymans var. lacrymans S7.9]EGO00271.1 hypothetical protein SERLA73DRAFT_136031 [Serpula lacrymans var. lacrymans S7.3]EGO25827.1 hypothetical protein SERLADRAFT_388360 [Serpula lacrymans var. lacrymans S7.9]